jgi:hypothetical protein
MHHLMTTRVRGPNDKSDESEAIAIHWQMLERIVKANNNPRQRIYGIENRGLDFNFLFNIMLISPLDASFPPEMSLLLLSRHNNNRQ